MPYNSQYEVLDNPQLRISYISAIDNLFEVVISRHISCEKQMPQLRYHKNVKPIQRIGALNGRLFSQFWQQAGYLLEYATM